MEASKDCKSTGISAKCFFKAWKKYTAEEDVKESLKKSYSDSTELTKIIISNEKSIINRIKKEITLECITEFRSTDVIFYKENDRPPLPNEPHITYQHTIRIAFEHENVLNLNVLQEISNLLTLNCELRVLVSHGDINSSKDLFVKFHEFISGCKESQKVSDERSFLFILGNKYETVENEIKEMQNITWKGYIYNTKEWTKLN